MMKRFTKTTGTLIVFTMMFFIAALTVQAGDKGIKLGTLTVKTVKGTGHNLIVKSSVDVTAVFTDVKGNKEYYIGEMGNKFGVDLSHKFTEDLGYAVFSPSSAYKTGSYALQGKYFGQRASVSAGVGGGVTVLLGGFDKSFTLQPLALSVNTGVGVSVGIGYLYLQRDNTK
jgi:hypothetical protein